MGGEVSVKKELPELVDTISKTAQGRMEELHRLAAMKKSNAPEFERMKEAMEGVSSLGTEASPGSILSCLEELEQASKAYQKHVDDDFMKRVSPIGKARRSFAADSASFASRMSEKFRIAAKGLAMEKGIQEQIAQMVRGGNAAKPMVETVTLAELEKTAGRKAGREAEKGVKVAGKGAKTAEKDGKPAGKWRVRSTEEDPEKKQEKGKKASLAPEMLRKVFGNERFNREFRAAIKQDTTPEDLTDEELMEFLCDAMEQCFEHCEEQEIEELEKLAEALGFEVTYEGADLVPRKERDKALRREMTREPGL